MCTFLKSSYSFQNWKVLLQKTRKSNAVYLLKSYSQYCILLYTIDSFRSENNCLLKSYSRTLLIHSVQTIIHTQPYRTTYFDPSIIFSNLQSSIIIIQFAHANTYTYIYTYTPLRKVIKRGETNQLQ